LQFQLMKKISLTEVAHQGGFKLSSFLPSQDGNFPQFRDAFMPGKIFCVRPGLILFLALIFEARFRSESYSPTSHKATTYRSKSNSKIHPLTSHKNSSESTHGVLWDSKGNIQRNSKTCDSFMKSPPCHGTGKTNSPCYGYVNDQIAPLKHGGTDSPSNLQFQTVEAAKTNDAGGRNSVT
jgi:hypothetical protein